MKADTAQAPLRFRGEPGRLEGYVKVPHDPLLALGKLSARIGAPEIITVEWPQVQNSAAPGGVTRFLLQLPETTPPGTYTGVLQAGEQRYPFEALIDPRPRFTVAPGKVSLVAGSGHEETVELIGTNSGNTIFDIPAAADVTLLDAGALSTAVNSALSSKEKGQDRVNRFVDSLARNTGLLSLEVTAGSGTIAPGETRTLSVVLRLPKNLHSGHSYSGGWDLPDTRYLIQIYVPAAAPEVEAKAS
jgi:hypothetical protein